MRGWQANPKTHLCVACNIRAMPEIEISPRFAGGYLFYTFMTLDDNTEIVYWKCVRMAVSRFIYVILAELSTGNNLILRLHFRQNIHQNFVSVSREFFERNPLQRRAKPENGFSKKLLIPEQYTTYRFLQ